MPASGAAGGWVRSWAELRMEWRRAGGPAGWRRARGRPLLAACSWANPSVVNPLTLICTSTRPLLRLLQAMLMAPMTLQEGLRRLPDRAVESPKRNFLKGDNKGHIGLYMGKPVGVFCRIFRLFIVFSGSKIVQIG